MVDDYLFDEWNEVKKKLDKKTGNSLFREGQIWWCSVGQNVGSETYGKGKIFARPVLVFKRLSAQLFIGIPLTTKQKKEHGLLLLNITTGK